MNSEGLSGRGASARAVFPHGQCFRTGSASVGHHGLEVEERPEAQGRGGSFRRVAEVLPHWQYGRVARATQEIQCQRVARATREIGGPGSCRFVSAGTAWYRLVPDKFFSRVCFLVGQQAQGAGKNLSASRRKGRAGRPCHPCESMSAGRPRYP
jgi:hypothetical protein